MYLINTRPDITFFVQQLSQFLAKLTIAHYIMQQLEFSDILKELQVLVYFSLPTLLLI